MCKRKEEEVMREEIGKERKLKEKRKSSGGKKAHKVDREIK